MAIINTIIHCGCPFSLQIFTMDHTHDCVDDNPETMNEHDESDHSGTTHYPEFQRHYVSTRTGIRPRPGQNQTRIYPQTYQAWKCNIIWKCINTQFGYMCEPLKLWLDTFKYISISPSPIPFHSHRWASAALLRVPGVLPGWQKGQHRVSGCDDSYWGGWGWWGFIPRSITVCSSCTMGCKEIWLPAEEDEWWIWHLARQRGKICGLAEECTIERLGTKHSHSHLLYTCIVNV